METVIKKVEAWDHAKWYKQIFARKSMTEDLKACKTRITQILSTFQVMPVEMIFVD